MSELTEEGRRIKDIILTVPIRFVDNPNGGICDELPVYIQEHHAENFARAISAAQAWQPISTAKKDRWYLVSSDDGTYMDVAILKPDGLWYVMSGSGDRVSTPIVENQPKYCMELPAPPSGDPT